MTNALAHLNNSLMMWEDSIKLNEIRKLFAPKLTEMEFQYFVGLGKAAGLNPFLKEIWSVKYDEKSPAQVFIGRDGYRKAAQAHPEYDYHQSDAVYENDVFEMNDGLLKHTYKLTNRGTLIGAYCIAKRHKSSRPMYVFVEVKEYTTGKSVWGQKPATMIKKVAESQCLRACFQDLLGGTYGEEEMSNSQMENNNSRIIQGETQTERLKNLLNIKKEDCILSSEENNYPDSVVLDSTGEIINPSLKPYNPTNIPISPEYLNKIEILMKEEAFDEERREKALKHFKVKKFSDLTEKDARDFLMQFGRI